MAKVREGMENGTRGPGSARRLPNPFPDRLAVMSAPFPLAAAFQQWEVAPQLATPLPGPGILAAGQLQVRALHPYWSWKKSMTLPGCIALTRNMIFLRKNFSLAINNRKLWVGIDGRKMFRFVACVLVKSVLHLNMPPTFDSNSSFNQIWVAKF